MSPMWWFLFTAFPLTSSNAAEISSVLWLRVFLFYFPIFFLSVDTSLDCLLSYEPLGHSAPLVALHCVQPWCPPSLYPSKLAASSNKITPSPHVIEDDASHDTSPSSSDANVNNALVWVHPHTPKCVRHPSPAVSLTATSLASDPPSFDVASITAQLCSLADALQESLRPISPPDIATTTPPPSPVLLSALPFDKISKLFHHPGSSLPSVRPCDTANASDTKTHWSAEEIHRIIGCQKFWNNKHILEVSHDGEWIDGGEFLLPLAPLLLFPNPNSDRSLTVPDTTFSMRCM